MNSRYNFVLRKDKEKNDMNIIGHVYTDFQEKFGIPRQSGLVDELTGTVVFLPEYRQPEAFRGLEDFSHIWILWEFHKAKRENWSATGLSSVKLTGIEYTDDYGPILHISGVDLLNGTPVYDIKPYIPYTDCHPDATGGFTEHIHTEKLDVIFPPELLAMIPEAKRPALIGILAEDPRPGYQHDPYRRYGVTFAGFDVRFYINGNVLTVCEVVAV